MTCGHCAGVVTKGVEEVDTAAQVSVDLETKVVRMESSHEAGDFLSAIQEAEYSPSVRTRPCISEGRATRASAIWFPGSHRDK
ncbi:Copper chaperone CopZ [Burkholderia sp. OK233]|nr:Copper chaperone CopZ [Burkholderia sp. OK233]